MATLTPKLGLKKPVVNVEIDWGSRLNETIDTLDDTLLTTNLTGADGVEVFDSGGGPVTVSGFRGETIAISGSLQSQININAAQIVTVSGHLQNVIDTLSIDDIEPAILGTNGNTVISGSSTITIQGFRPEFVAASGTLQTQINAIDNSVTLQDAFDNGTGSIVTTSGKTFSLPGPGGLVVVTGTFSKVLRFPQYATDPAPTNGDVWINTTTSGIRWRSNSTTFEVQGSELITRVYRYTGTGVSGKTVPLTGINRARIMTFMRYSTAGNHAIVISMPDGDTGTVTRRNSSGAGFSDISLSAPAAGSSQVLTINNTLGTMNASAGIYRITVQGTKA